MNNSFIYSLLDITSLQSTDHEAEIEKLIHFVQQNSSLGYVPAAVCVYPNFSNLVSKAFENTSIKTAVVGACFPASQSFMPVKLLECELALDAGAQELDIVINLGDFYQKKYDSVVEEIKSVKSLMGTNDKLKVILETGVLEDTGLIKKAVELAIRGGADFVKTSTGKTPVGATISAVEAMCQSIGRHYQETGKRIGIKVSGGVKTKKDAIDYLSIVEDILGTTQINPAYFRIGASSLAKELVTQP